jgi:hypothetical protein
MGGCMEVTWFTEMSFSGKTQRNHGNMRTEFAWFVAQDAQHFCISNLSSLADKSVDIGIIIIPKHVEHFMHTDVVSELKRVCVKYGFMQEGPSWYYQSLPLDQLLWFYNIMINADFVLAHNDIDKSYYEGLLGKLTFINPTLMIEDPISISSVPRAGTIIGGNLVRWYGGFNSFIVAQESNELIYAPQMGRMDKLELQIEEINHLPYLQWSEWMSALNNFKYAVHMNPNTIGGTFHLNCAYLGIPCIGNIHTNTQRLCFPELSVEPDDITAAKQLMQRLRKDEDFYLYCSNKARKLYMMHFHEDIYRLHWTSITDSILNAK